MKVTLMNKPQLEQNLLAWRKSRPKDDALLHNVLPIDLPTNEFAHFNLFIEASIIEREVFATARNHIMWAQTSRVQNVLEFVTDSFSSNEAYGNEFPSMLSWRNKKIEEKRGEMQLMANKGIRQDDYRLLLPMSSQTKFSVSLSLRDLVNTINNFYHLAKCVRVDSADGVGLSDRYHLFADMLSNVLADGGLQHLVGNYRMKRILNESSVNALAPSCHNGIITVTCEMPYHLRAQLVRHRNIGVVDDLFQRITQEQIISETISDTMMITVYGTEDAFREIASKRTCWIANYSVWSDFLGKLSDVLDLGSSLPCAGGKCPYHGDAILRYEGQDPNPPCPIHLVEQGLIISDACHADIEKMIYDDERPVDFWLDKLEAVEVE